MISNLAELIAPLSQADLYALLRARAPVLRRGMQHAGHLGLMNWEILAATIDGRVFPEDDLRLTRGPSTLPPAFYTTDGKVDIAKTEAVLARGASIVVSHADRYVPALGALRDSIRAETGERVLIGCIVTSGAGGAFSAHYDCEDIIVLQVEGAKRWRFTGPPVDRPVKGMPPMPAPEGEPIFDAVVQTGDVLFVPAGNWHRCENGEGRSMHLGVMIEAPTPWHALRALVDELVMDEDFRVPLTRDCGPAAEAEIKQRLKARIDAMSLVRMGRRGQ